MLKQQLCRAVIYGSRVLGVDGLIPDKWYLQMLYRRVFDKKLDLDNPKTFNEKLQWMKLYDRRPVYTTMVDKYAVKEYVAKMIGEEYVIPTLGVWDRSEDIDWDALPDQFVLKCTHDSGGLVICRDKSKLDKEAAKEKLRKSLKRNYYKAGREWPYKNVPRRIIAEKYMEVTPKVKDLPDYKWYCFNGEPTYCQVIQDRSTEETIDFFDKEWKHQDFVGLNPAAGPAAVPPARPATLETQIKIARELSKDMPFARIDLYSVNDRTWFGEVTLYPTSGTSGVFTPDAYNEILGSMIKLPGEKVGGVIIELRPNGSLEYRHPDLPDYKVFNFGGEPKFVELDYDRFVAHKRNIYTADWEKTEIKINYPSGESKVFSKPEVFEELKNLCRKVSKGIPFVRSDFYIVNDRIYFGELTFFPESGFLRITPEEYQHTLGQWLVTDVADDKVGGGKLLMLRNNNIIVAMRILPKPGGDLPDYKFFCFDGEVKAMFVGTERGTGDVKFDYFDADFNHLDIVQVHPMSGRDLPKPQHFDKMKQLASTLSKGYPQVRVDFYNINGAIYFGELTLFHHGGVVPFHPEKWDYEFGSWIELSEKKK